jgi:hypothetical protein
MRLICYERLQKVIAEGTDASANPGCSTGRRLNAQESGRGTAKDKPPEICFWTSKQCLLNNSTPTDVTEKTVPVPASWVLAGRRSTRTVGPLEALDGARGTPAHGSHNMRRACSQATRRMRDASRNHVPSSAARRCCMSLHWTCPSRGVLGFRRIMNYGWERQHQVNASHAKAIGGNGRTCHREFSNAFSGSICT